MVFCLVPGKKEEHACEIGSKSGPFRCRPKAAGTCSSSYSSYSSACEFAWRPDVWPLGQFAEQAFLALAPKHFWAGLAPKAGTLSVMHRPFSLQARLCRATVQSPPEAIWFKSLQAETDRFIDRWPGGCRIEDRWAGRETTDGINNGEMGRQIKVDRQIETYCA